jgi:hypothetical protein
MILTIQNYFRSLLQKAADPETRDRDELQRLGVLQQIASGRRAEYAEAREKAERANETALWIELSAIRNRMDDAETTHYLALQTWENRESGQKSF